MTNKPPDSNIVHLYKAAPRPATYDPMREIPVAALTSGGPLPPVEEGLRLVNAYFAIGEPAVRTALLEHAERLADAFASSRQAGTK